MNQIGYNVIIVIKLNLIFLLLLLLRLEGVDVVEAMIILVLASIAWLRLNLINLTLHLD